MKPNNEYIKHRQFIQKEMDYIVYELAKLKNNNDNNPTIKILTNKYSDLYNHIIQLNDWELQIRL